MIRSFLAYLCILLGLTIVLPLFFGVTGRLFVFRRDDDDIYKVKGKKSERPVSPSTELLSPEPKPFTGGPWQDFPPSPDYSS